MKKILFLLIWIMLLQWPLAANAKSIRVVTTTEDLAAISRAVGGDRVEVNFIAKGLQDPHFIDAKPSYMLKLSRADLFVQIGRGLEVGWVPPLLAGARNSRIQPGNEGHVNASQGIALLEIPTGRIDRSAGDVHAEGNPHYWLDPMNEQQIAQNIAAGLIRIDPVGKETYERNLRHFSKKLDAAIKQWSEAMQPFEGEKVITYHNSWPYFLKRFALRAIAYVEPKPGIPPSTVHLKQLIEKIKAEGVRIIIVEPYFNGKVARFIARKSGARIIVLPPSVSEKTGIADTFHHFDYLVTTLSDALKNKR